MTQSLNTVPLQFAYRLLMFDYTGHDRVKLWMQQLPSELPVELPLIEQSQLIASLQQRQTFTILIQAPLNPLIIRNWYSNHLRIQGWLQWQSEETIVDLRDFHIFGSQLYGHGYGSNSLLVFRYYPKSIWLTLQTYPSVENVTFVKLKLSARNMSTLPSEKEWERNTLNLLPLPQLAPPPSTDIKKLRAGGSNKEWNSEAQVQTLLNELDLLTHYEEQLVQSSWTKQLSDVQDGLLWSVWNLHDRNNQTWQLVLSFIADTNKPNHYAASLRLLNLDDFEYILPPATIDVVSPTESIPEEVLWHFLSDDFSSRNSKQLWVGQLPPTLPNSLNFPEQTEVLGSLVEENQQIDLFLRVSLPSKQICELLIKQLVDFGWQQWTGPTDFEGPGFVTSILPRVTQCSLLHPTDGSQCIVICNSVTLNCTDVTIRWLPSVGQPGAPPGESNRSRLQGELVRKSIPTLALADQTEVIRRTIQTGDRFMFSAYLITSLSIEVLVNHYQTEMRQAGWQQQVMSQVENCHLSLWSFIDEQRQLWQGVLYFLAVPNKTTQFTGLLRIEPLNYK
ncbi:hypothetical protein [Vacuolonema iberomarrocanum]|uniref:hypothetical protein n=1 Tax=Vacuolonema iberomarrocanum TaxID=3454632 RepID=UPI0019D9CA3D|nr:hypothetical protein [filamentous cyanobacterium LEGE 07170]